jgi:hypothetical protein
MDSQIEPRRSNSGGRSGVRLDDIRRLFRNGNDRGDGVPTDLIREDGCVDDAQALDPKHAQAWVDDARLRGGADARGRRLEGKKCA